MTLQRLLRLSGIALGGLAALAIIAYVVVYVLSEPVLRLTSRSSGRAKARRRLALVFGLMVLFGFLIWLGYRYGWPWLRAYWQ